MPSVGFEPLVSAGERPQTYALDGATTGTGCEHLAWWNKELSFAEYSMLCVFLCPLWCVNWIPAFLISIAVHQSFRQFFLYVFYFCCYCFVAACLLTVSHLFCSVIGSLHNGRAAHIHRYVTSYYSDDYVLSCFDAGNNLQPDTLWFRLVFQLKSSRTLYCKIEPPLILEGPGGYYMYH